MRPRLSSPSRPVERDGLVLGDRLAERLALLRIPASSNARIPTPHARADTLTLPTSMPSIIWKKPWPGVRRGCRRPGDVAVEDHLGGVDALVAELVDLARDHQPGCDFRSRLAFRPGTPSDCGAASRAPRRCAPGRHQRRAPPLVSHIFWPSMVYVPSSLRLARVRIAATSEPSSGSDIENAPRALPVAIRGRNRCFCSSVPC